MYISDKIYLAFVNHCFLQICNRFTVQKRIGYNLNVMRQSACLVINPITVDGYAALFNCRPVDWASDSMMARPKAIHFSWLGPELSSVAWSIGAQLIIFFCFRFSVVLFDRPGISIRHAAHCTVSTKRNANF